MSGEDDELFAGELAADEVRCGVCGCVGRARKGDPRSLGAKLLPEFETLPEGWTLVLGESPLPVCSKRCGRRLGRRLTGRT